MPVRTGMTVEATEDVGVVQLARWVAVGHWPPSYYEKCSIILPEWKIDGHILA
jgi:hypothetical protein